MNNVLIADHNVEAACKLADALASLGIITAVAFSEEHAVQAARRCVPDQIFIDLCLPIHGGFSALRALKQLDTLATTKFVALSYVMEPPVTFAIGMAGFDNHLRKPISLPVALNTIVNQLQSRPYVTSSERRIDKQTELRVE